MQVMDAILTKRAIRQFENRLVPEEDIRRIVNAGRRAQSSKNSQPWQFLAVQDRETLQKLSTLGTYAGHIAGAAFTVVILTPDPASLFSIMFDAGQAAAYMQLAAWEMGIGSCLATVYEPERAGELLGFPEELHVRIAISFGYPAAQEAMTAPPRKGGRIRMDQILHMDRW